MRALITGGAGFIGSHLAEQLVELNYSVTVLDDFSTGSLENLSDCPKSRLDVIKGSVRDASLVCQLVSNSDIVYHLASVVGVRRVLERPTETLLTGILGSVNVLDATAQSGKPCVLVSSSEVYGKSGNSGRALTESAPLLLGSPTNYRWGYSIAKLTEESLAVAYCKEKGVQAIVIRPFNVIGPRQSGQYGMVVPRFIGSALRNEDIRVFGDGRQRRAFLNVRDATSMMIKLQNFIEVDLKIVNIGSSETISILKLAQLVVRLTNSKSRIVTDSEKELGPGFEDVRDRCPCTSLLASLIESPRLKTIEESLLEIIDGQA